MGFSINRESPGKIASKYTLSHAIPITEKIAQEESLPSSQLQQLVDTEVDPRSQLVSETIVPRAPQYTGKVSYGVKESPLPAGASREYIRAPTTIVRPI